MQKQCRLQVLEIKGIANTKRLERRRMEDLTEEIGTEAS